MTVADEQLRLLKEKSVYDGFISEYFKILDELTISQRQLREINVENFGFDFDDKINLLKAIFNEIVEMNARKK